MRAMASEPRRGADPGDAYATRLADRRTLFDALSRRDAQFSAARLVTFGVAGALAIAWWQGWIQAAWLVLPAASFAVLIQRHDTIIREDSSVAAWLRRD